MIRHEAESQIHDDIKSHRLRELNGKNVDMRSSRRRHKFTLHDVQSGGYGEYIGLPEDQLKFLINQ